MQEADGALRTPHGRGPVLRGWGGVSKDERALARRAMPLDMRGSGAAAGRRCSARQQRRFVKRNPAALPGDTHLSAEHSCGYLAVCSTAPSGRQERGATGGGSAAGWAACRAQARAEWGQHTSRTHWATLRAALDCTQGTNRLQPAPRVIPSKVQLQPVVGDRVSNSSRTLRETCKDCARLCGSSVGSS